MRLNLPVIEAGLVIGKINLKTQKISLEGSKPIKFACASTAECCSNLKIPVTDFDIKRIEDNGYALDQIVESLTPQLRLPKTKYGNIEKNYWMKRNPFTDTCTFLEGKFCKIHDFKPFGCKVFPFSLHYESQDLVVVRIHSSNLCKTVTFGSEDDSDNRVHLMTLLQIILEEEAVRGQYLEKYGDKI